MIKYSTFKPPWWLKNAHIQSCMKSIFRPGVIGQVHWETLDLPDGDFIDLSWHDSNHYNNPSSPLIILLHGLEGSVNSSYIQWAISQLNVMGWTAVTMHFRSCSGRINCLSRTYHGGDTTDLHVLLDQLSRRFPGRPMAAVGFSIGGNVLLNYLAESQDNPLLCTVVVSVPFELGACTSTLASFYQKRLLNKMKKKIARKISMGQVQPVSLKDLSKINSLRDFDERITAKMFGFINADDYYSQASSRSCLSLIQTPTKIIQAEDDPFVPKYALPSASELSSSTQMHISHWGGHLGFVNQVNGCLVSDYLEKEIAFYFEKFFI